MTVAIGVLIGWVAHGVYQWWELRRRMPYVYTSDDGETTFRSSSEVAVDGFRRKQEEK
jgi:hypothetical protein